MLTESDAVIKSAGLLIESWREEFFRLPTADQEAVNSTLDDLREPCQVSIVWIRNLQLEIDRQLWIITHFDDHPDLEVVVDGPIETNDVLQELISVAQAPRFDRPLPKSTIFLGIGKYSDLIESQLPSLVSGLRDDMLRSAWTINRSSSRDRPVMRQRLFDQAVSWVFDTSPSHIDIVSLVGHLIQELKDRARGIEQARTTPPAEARSAGEETTRRAGFGSYLYPHVWIGDKPVIPIDRQIQEAMFSSRSGAELMGFQSIVYHREIGSFHVVARQDGFVGVTIEDRIDALRTLNMFMGIATLVGNPALPLMDRELQSIVVDIDSNQIVSVSGALSLPRMLPAHPTTPTSIVDVILRGSVSIERFEELWTVVASMNEMQSVADLVILFGEIFKHFQNEEYSACVIFASMWIENWSVIVAEDSELDEGNRTGSTRSRYSVLQAIQMLNVLSELELGVEQQLRDLARIRNLVVHGIEPATRDNAEAALSVVAALMTRLEI